MAIFKKVTKIRPLLQKPAKYEVVSLAQKAELDYVSRMNYFSRVCANCGSPNQGGYSCTLCDRPVQH